MCVLAHTNNHFLILSLYVLCNEFSNSYCDDDEGYARVSSLLLACLCVCVTTFCCCSTASKCATKPIKLLKKKERINLLQKGELIIFFERAKKKKNGKIEERVLKQQ